MFFATEGFIHSELVTLIGLFPSIVLEVLFLLFLLPHFCAYNGVITTASLFLHLVIFITCYRVDLKSICLSVWVLKL